MWLGSSRSASSPAYSRGCSVFTRPPMISGKPVKSSIGRTSRPASFSAVAVPPVETSSTPSAASPRAKSTIPVLSETDSTARAIRTSPGCVTPSLPSRPDDTSRRHQDAPRMVRVQPNRVARDQGDRLAQQVVLDGAQRLAHLGGLRRERELDRALEDDRARVDALVDEVHRHAEDLHAV